ncbi:MAG: NRDE family protein [Endozoicomonas sp.]
MCLIVFSWQPEAEYPLALAANRDEFYRRPTRPVHFWEDHSDIIGGRDLEAGGTWMAFNRDGRFAAVTNYREVPPPRGKFSRGKLISDYLKNSLAAREYLASVAAVIEDSPDDWSGFNLLAGDSSGLYYYSNRSDSIQSLDPGLYGLSNRLLDTPWPKLQKAKQDLQALLDSHNYAAPERIVSIMHNPTQYPDDQLPDTGVEMKTERLLSSCFIASPDYGTRNTSALVLHSSGKLLWHEQLYETEGTKGEFMQFELALPIDLAAKFSEASTL